MKRRLKKMFILAMLALACLAVCAGIILNQAKFGKSPEGERLAAIESSPNYRGGEFKNTVPTAVLAEGESSLQIMWSGLFGKTERLRPEGPLPTVRVDIKALDPDRDMFIWLGHSSYFIHLGGKRILVDPVFSDHGAPFSVFNKIFAGTDLYTAGDMPQIDLLIISHDHWDHLDYATVAALVPQVESVIVPLGVGAHFEHWGYGKDKLREADWHSALSAGGDLAVHVVPARHYSGRLFAKNQTLWAGFVLESPRARVFLSGDSGYGPHIIDIAAKFSSFDLVAIDGGQYDPRWPLIHMTPEEAAQAAEDLRARSMLLAHTGKFCIANHLWDEPFIRAAEAAKGKSFKLLTPQMGEPVWLGETEQTFTHWWEGIK